ncbi:RES family NAD+ phosphorylase [Bacteroides sp. 224]|uniref:RES family NAD+ phosphorylase n=1 Tax=Bacteroides sp. 224 TaxID=2302936 RepID=UPI0013D7206F|nr:RES family NAD+ phosphorylase [Bacteroides sp. 224]NDV65294.1 RES domain-containing protein [Bacteroides sp. 224]
MSISKLNKKIKDELLKRREQSYENELSKIFELYRKGIAELKNSESILSKDEWGKVIKNVEALCDTIIKAFDYYSSARIADCYQLIKDYISENATSTSLNIYSISCDNKEDAHWYRMRKKESEKELFRPREMFHIPFELRGKIQTQRYSIPGYPCLYLGRTIHTCWAEMHELSLSDFYVSRVEVVEDIRLLDLRLPVNDFNIEHRGDLIKILNTYPLIIACSIKTYNQSDSFKPEYIIPQQIMLTLAENSDIIGCIYSSTRKNPVFQWNEIVFDNIAIPVRDAKAKEGYCSKLKNLFKITMPTSYEYEIIKKPFQTILFNYNESSESISLEYPEQYKDSIFGQIESRLLSKEAKLIYNWD